MPFIQFLKTLLLLTCCTSLVASPLQESLPSLSPHDAHIVLNLLYYSYQRSAVTLATQHHAIQSLEQHWGAWKECLVRRLNPNKCSHACNPPSCTVFALKTEEYHALHTAYTHIISVATLGASYQQDTTLTLVSTIREDARRLMFQSMCELLRDIKYKLEQLMTSQTWALRTLSHEDALLNDSLFFDLEAEDIAKTRTGLISFMLNQFAVSSFAEFDAYFTTKTDELMRSFFTAQKQFNRLWDAIEVTRCSYYASQYRILYTYMKDNSFPQSSFYLMTHEPDVTTSHEMLPSPESLVNL